MKEDPTRDPASEARDDHASEPRATPETNAAYLVIRGSDSIHACHELQAMATFARRLERERDEAREHAANAEASLKMAINSANARQSETEHAMRERDELLGALYAIEERFVDGCDTYEDWQFMGQTARSAIAAVKGGRP